MASDRAYARAKHRFVPQTGSEIPLEVGDILLIISKEDSGWWKGKVICTQKSNVGLTGYFPGSYTVSASSPKEKLKGGSVKEMSIDEYDEKVLVGFNTDNSRLKEDAAITDKDCSELSQTIKVIPHVPIKTTCQSSTVGPPVQSRKSNRTNGEVLFVINSSEKADSKMKTIYRGGKRVYKYNSTTTIMTVDSTISKPNIKASIRSIALLICSLVSKGSKYVSKFDEDEKTFHHKSFKNQVKRGDEPTEESISEFINIVFYDCQLEVDCIITSYIYIRRIVDCGLPLTRLNVRSITLAALLLASKVSDDESMWNCDFAKTFKPQINQKKINEWEALFLAGIRFNVVVSTSEYTKLYFLLREHQQQAKIQIAPLNQTRAEELEALSTIALKRLKAINFGNKRRAATFDSCKMPSPLAIFD